MKGVLPSILTGLRFACAIAWIALVSCETVNAKSGIGYMLYRAQTFARREMQDLLAALAREYGLSVVMVTHDREEARRFTDTVFVLENGKLHGESA